MDKPDVTFAGKLLVRDGRNLIECAIDPGVVAFRAYKLDGAFLTQVPDTGAWLFVAGIPWGRTLRHALLDDGPDRERAAQDLHALGVRILSATETQAEYEAGGVLVYNITATERAQADAAARAAARCVS